jgi:hypothetical protein
MDNKSDLMALSAISHSCEVVNTIFMSEVLAAISNKIAVFMGVTDFLIKLAHQIISIRSYQGEGIGDMIFCQNV